MYLQTVLHNLALLYGDIVEPEDEEDHDDTPEPHNFEARAGENVRDTRVCSKHSCTCSPLARLPVKHLNRVKHFTIHAVSFPFLAKFHFMFTITYFLL